MRAIEEGRYLARAANTGISGFVDPYGRVIAKTALFEPAVVVAGRSFHQGTGRSTIGSATSSPGCHWRSRWPHFSRRCEESR